MACGQHAGSDLLLHGTRQIQQSQGIGDLRAGFRHGFRKLRLRQTEVVDHLLVCGGLFQWIQCDAMQVLQQRVTQHIVVGGGFDDRGNRVQSGDLRRAPATFAHDELVHAVHAAVEHVARFGTCGSVGRRNGALLRVLGAMLRGTDALLCGCVCTVLRSGARGHLLARGLDLRHGALAHDDRLEHADFLDGFGEFAKVVLVEDGSWLVKVGTDIAYMQFDQVSTLDRKQLLLLLLLRVIGLLGRIAGRVPAGSGGCRRRCIVLVTSGRRGTGRHGGAEEHVGGMGDLVQRDGRNAGATGVLLSAVPLGFT